MEKKKDGSPGMEEASPKTSSKADKKVVPTKGKKAAEKKTRAGNEKGTKPKKGGAKSLTALIVADDSSDSEE